MTTIVPAVPGWNVLHVDEDGTVWRDPIIAWALTLYERDDCADGVEVEPVTCDGTLPSNEVVESPTGIFIFLGGNGHVDTEARAIEVLKRLRTEKLNRIG